MPTFEQLKDRAKMTLRANYGGCVATLLIVLLLICVASYTVIGAVLVAMPLTLGLLCYFLMVFQGAQPDFSVVFTTGFCHSLWTKNWRIPVDGPLDFPLVVTFLYSGYYQSLFLRDDALSSRGISRYSGKRCIKTIYANHAGP